MATLELAEHGMAGPLTCGASHVNVEAWYYYGLMHLPIMGLAKRSGGSVWSRLTSSSTTRQLPSTIQRSNWGTPAVLTKSHCAAPSAHAYLLCGTVAT